MPHANPSLRRTARLAVLLLAGASLAACASVQPKYAARGGVSGGAIGGAGGSTVRPNAAPGLHGTNQPYQVAGIWYVPHDQPRYDETGVASWYGDAFNMKATADGEIFDMNQFSAAHTTLPLPSMVEVTNLDNGRKLVVRVNDRGPFVDNRLIDLSHAAATELGYDRSGLAHVRVRYIGPAPLAGPGAGMRMARATAPAAAAVQLAQAGTLTKASWFKPAYPTTLSAADEDAYATRSAVARPARATGPAYPITASPPTATPADAAIPSATSSASIGISALPPPTPVGMSSLAPLPAPAAGPSYLPAPLPRAIPTAAPVAMASSSAPLAHFGPAAFRVQAGAFGDQANAQRAAAQLAPAGKAVIEPVQRGGMTLYRVTVAGPADEAEAYALRDKVAQIGFADARVLSPAS